MGGGGVREVAGALLGLGCGELLLSLFIATNC